MIHVSCHSLIKIMRTLAAVYDQTSWATPKVWRFRRACDLEVERPEKMVVMESVKEILGLAGDKTPNREEYRYEITCPECGVMYDQAIEFRNASLV